MNKELKQGWNTLIKCLFKAEKKNIEFGLDNAIDEVDTYEIDDSLEVIQKLKDFWEEVNGEEDSLEHIDFKYWVIEVFGIPDKKAFETLVKKISNKAGKGRLWDVETIDDETIKEMCKVFD